MKMDGDGVSDKIERDAIEERDGLGLPEAHTEDEGDVRSERYFEIVPLIVSLDNFESVGEADADLNAVVARGDLENVDALEVARGDHVSVDTKEGDRDAVPHRDVVPDRDGEPVAVVAGETAATPSRSEAPTSSVDHAHACAPLRLEHPSRSERGALLINAAPKASNTL